VSIKTEAILILLTLGVICFPLPGGAGWIGPNLVPNPEFKGLEESALPIGWHQPLQKIPGVEPSRVFPCRVIGHLGKLLALVGGPDRAGRVWCEISGVHPYSDYLLEFAALRPQFTNGVYLELEIFGQRHLINQHLTYGRVQPIFLRINSGATPEKTRLVVINPHKEVLAFGSPSLRAVASRPADDWKAQAVRLATFFPVGIFNARLEDLPDIRAAGFNAVQSYEIQPEMIRRMAAAADCVGLKFLPNFRQYQPEISRELGGRPSLLGFYIEDEPESRSVPPEDLRAFKESLKRDHPGVLTAVAMIRPRMVAEYRDATDIFMLDPYPVPQMPLTWMSDTLEEAARHVSRRRLWAVVQAFGGEKHRLQGWPRRPTFLEMRCLTYLALAHGAQGLFYFSYPEIRGDKAAWEDLKRIVGELEKLQNWLRRPNEPAGNFRVEMTSPFKADASGGPAVHFCHKRRGAERLLILVNVIDRPVSFYLHGLPPQAAWVMEFFGGKQSAVLQGNIREGLGPYEVRVYRYHQGD
jgi:hypothetical protein